MMSEAPAGRGGLFEDLIEVLYQPSAVFERTRAAKAFMYMLVTAILVAVIAIATKNLMLPWLDAQADVTLKIAAAKGTPIPEAAAASTRSFTTWGVVIGAPLTMLIGPYFNAAFILLGAKIVKANITFGQAAVVATLAGVPRVLGWIALPVQALLSNAESARSLADLSLGPARFIDPVSTPPAILTLLSNLDVFRFWQLALVAIGVAVVSRTSKGTGAVVAIVMFGIGALLQIAPSALF